MTERIFKKILIANRGEIALRVMRTCRAMGISTVAVYSDADAHAPHARAADEAVHIGPPPSRDSYLNIERIIEAAKRTGAEAVHPGYGFLSENAEFAEACEAAGLTFIGPWADAIRNMGLKSVARRIMSEAGVPVVPGYDGEDQDSKRLSEEARAIGFPLLLKASAGGGGKGMRVVRDARELADSIEAARRESEKSFGDGALLIEKYIDGARHVEVQILGDNHGNLIHLFERDCSIQRRHQKLIEESPSPALDDDGRRRICETALAAARAIGYTNAGTVEFILAPSGEFYFIEVNARLQVEHPVTEMITGVDLVRLQVEIAEGRPLSIRQQDLRRSGHAIEARLCAEEPSNDFLPATGTVLAWHAPAIDGVRTDSGIERGTEVGIHYDPLLAKLIAHGPDRRSALRKLAYALTDLALLGVQTNREFLIRALEHAKFQRGEYDTGFVGEHSSELIAKDAGEDALFAAVIVLELHRQRREQAEVLPNIPASYRNNPFREPSMTLHVEGVTCGIIWKPITDDSIDVSCQDWQANLRLVSSDSEIVRVAVDGVQRNFRIARSGDQFFVQSGASSRLVTRPARYPRADIRSEHESAFAPMPGQVLKILVEAGQQVSAGDPLVILEAMKMEQTLRASTAGVVQSVLVKPGDVVAPGDTLVEISARQSA